MLLGGTRRLAASRDRATLTTGVQPPWGEASPQVVQLESNPPALLTLENPRATARLRLNVKVFNMGENSPWLTIIEGSDSGRPSRSTLFSCRSSMASIRQLGLPGTRSLAASSAERCHQFGTPVSSPWHDLGEPVGFIVIAMPPLNCVSCFVSTLYGDRTAGRRGRVKQGICTEKRRPHNWRNPTFFDRAASPIASVNAVRYVRAGGKNFGRVSIGRSTSAAGPSDRASQARRARRERAAERRPPSRRRRHCRSASGWRGRRSGGGGGTAAGHLEENQLVALHSRLSEERDDATGQIAGESVVEAAADQQVTMCSARCDRSNRSEPACRVPGVWLQRCEIVSDGMALGEIAVGEVVSRVVTRMGARHGGEVDAAQVEPEPLVDLVEEIERSDRRRNESMKLSRQRAMASHSFSAGAMTPYAIKTPKTQAAAIGASGKASAPRLQA